MKFIETSLPGVFEIELEPIVDERGFFARTFDAGPFTERGLPGRWAQHNLSRNLRRGTLRGLHGVKPGFEEAKLVSCTRGAIWDVVVDLRSDSPTQLQWHAVVLSAARGNALFIPTGCLHGFQTLEDEADVFYCMSAPFDPEAAFSARFDDPKLGISWPLPEPVLSPRDQSHPNL